MSWEVNGVVPRNGGDGMAPTEAMSPCPLAGVREAVDSIGMARSLYMSPLGLKAVVTIDFSAKGSY